MHGQGHLAGARDCAAAHQRDGGGGVMRRPIRPLLPQGRIKPARADRLHGRRLQGFRFGHRRQDARQALREHGLAGPRWPDHEQAVATGGGDFQRAPRLRLAFDIHQIRVMRSGKYWRGHCARQLCMPGEMRADIHQRGRRINFGAVSQRRFRRIGRRHHKATAVTGNRQRHRQRAAHRAQLAGQRQFPGKLETLQTFAWNLPRRRQNTQCDRQVEAPRFLGQIGRGQIDGDAPCREFKPCIEQRSTHAVLGFFDLGLGQADDGKTRQAVAQMRFHGNQWRIKAGQRTAVKDGEGHGVPGA